MFIPPRDQAPQDPPPEQTNLPENVKDIAPPIPKQPPDNLNNLDTQATVDPSGKQDLGLPVWWQTIIVRVGMGVGGILLLVSLLAGIKVVRGWWRYRRGTHVRQIAGGWAEVIDCARDLGVKVPKAMTRTEQATALGMPALVDLAQSANRAMFQSAPPDRGVVDSFWNQVAQVKTALGSGRSGIGRLWARITPRSLISSSLRLRT
jgi:hypothetical protein